jgi:hypothetical protein
MTTAPTHTALSERARAIADGLFRTKRAMRRGIYEIDMLRLTCRTGGHYWISFDGRRVLRGFLLSEAEELQPKFIDAMERAGQ